VSARWNEALVAAQQLREEDALRRPARGPGHRREAEAEARRVVDEARAAQGEVERQSADVERQFQAYVAGFRALLERQLAELRALDASGADDGRGGPRRAGADEICPRRRDHPGHRARRARDEVAWRRDPVRRDPGFPLSTVETMPGLLLGTPPAGGGGDARAVSLV